MNNIRAPIVKEGEKVNNSIRKPLFNDTDLSRDNSPNKPKSILKSKSPMTTPNKNAFNRQTSMNEVIKISDSMNAIS